MWNPPLKENGGMWNPQPSVRLGIEEPPPLKMGDVDPPPSDKMNAWMGWMTSRRGFLPNYCRVERFVPLSEVLGTHTHHSKTHTDPIFQHTKACPKNTLAQHPTQNYTWIKNDVICLYRIIHKGWDCKDDLKLSKYGDFLVEFNLLTWI